MRLCYTKNVKQHTPQRRGRTKYVGKLQKALEADDR